MPKGKIRSCWRGRGSCSHRAAWTSSSSSTLAAASGDGCARAAAASAAKLTTRTGAPDCPSRALQDHPEQRHLIDVLRVLQERGYSCFWQANSGRLGRVGPGEFWCDSFKFRFRSNLVCSHVPSILGVLRSIADV